MSKLERFDLRIDAKLKAAAKAKAEAEDSSLARVIRMLLKLWLAGKMRDA